MLSICCRLSQSPPHAPKPPFQTEQSDVAINYLGATVGAPKPVAAHGATGTELAHAATGTELGLHPMGAYNPEHI